MLVFYVCGAEDPLEGWATPEVLLRDRRHELTALHSPIYEHLGFFPARVHRFALKKNDDDKVTVFFKGAGKTGSRRLRDPRFRASDAVDAQEAIRVHPAIEVVTLDVDSLELLFDARRL